MSSLDENEIRKKPDPGLWRLPEMRAALAARDIPRVYLILRREGVSQRRIEVLTGRSELEVSAILRGRRVLAYDVLLGIVDDLGIPRGLAGMSSCRCEEARREDEATRLAILAAYERLRKNPEAWKSYLAELHEWTLP